MMHLPYAEQLRRNRTALKQGIIEKLQAFFDKYFGI